MSSTLAELPEDMTLDIAVDSKPFNITLAATDNLNMDLLLRRGLPLQEFSLLDPALLQINKDDQEQEARQAQRKEEIERQAVVPARVRVDDRAADERPNE